MQRFREVVPILVVVLFAFPPLARAQATYTQIDVPGSVATICLGINAVGEIVGGYSDSGLKGHGFVLSGGVYTTIDYPGAEATGAYGINDVGQIVGAADFFSGLSVGYVYDRQTQQFTEIADPGVQSIFPTDVDNTGSVVGYESQVQGGTLVSTGFEWTGTFQYIVPSGYADSFVTGISTSGEIIGCAAMTNVSGCRPFLYSNGIFQWVPLPKTPFGNFSINASGTISGVQPFHHRAIGFVLQSQEKTEIRFPLAFNTYDYGINDGGQVVGQITNPDHSLHGFLWTPPAPEGREVP